MSFGTVLICTILKSESSFGTNFFQKWTVCTILIDMYCVGFVKHIFYNQTTTKEGSRPKLHTKARKAPAQNKHLNIWKAATRIQVCFSNSMMVFNSLYWLLIHYDSKNRLMHWKLYSLECDRSSSPTSCTTHYLSSTTLHLFLMFLAAESEAIKESNDIWYFFYQSKALDIREKVQNLFSFYKTFRAKRSRKYTFRAESLLLTFIAVALILTIGRPVPAKLKCLTTRQYYLCDRSV